MKAFLIVLALLTSGLIGSKLADKYRKKERFYFDILSFCSLYRANLEYRRRPISELLGENRYETEFVSYAEKLIKTNQEYKNDVNFAELFEKNCEKYGEKHEKNDEKGLKNREKSEKNASKTAKNGEKTRQKSMFFDDEKDYIDRFFQILGNGDSASQDKETEFYAKYFEKKLNEMQELKRVKAPLTLKISLLCGFLFCILII